MIRRTLLLAATAAVLVSMVTAVGAPVAWAGAIDVVRDCAEDEVLDRRHSRAEKKAALRNLPGDVAEYTDCRSIIAAAIGSGRGGERDVATARGATGGAGGRAGIGSVGATGGADGAGGASGGAPVRARERVEATDSDEGVAGSVISGAEAIGKAPLDVVGDAAGGRLGVPGYVWGLLIAVALIGLGVLREYRSSVAD